jgi:hypothetical protein
LGDSESVKVCQQHYLGDIESGRISQYDHYVMETQNQVYCRVWIKKETQNKLGRPNDQKENPESGRISK